MKHEVTFGIIAAMDSELTELAAHLQDTERTRAGGLELLTGRLGTHSVVLVRCGVGKVSAARCASSGSKLPLTKNVTRPQSGSISA